MTRALLLLALFVTPAFAQSAQEQAKAHFKQGKAYQDAGAYAKAADEYKAAYELDQRPEMLFNIAQAYRLAGERQPALDYFQRYLDAQPSGAGAEEARQHIATLTKQLEEEKPKQTPPPKQPVAPQPQPPPRSEPVATEVRGPAALRIAGLASAGLGLAACGLGVKFGLDARDASDKLSGHVAGTPWSDAEKATFEDGRAANRNMIISYVAGGALVATGAILYWRGARTTVVPAATTTSASIALQGRF